MFLIALFQALLNPLPAAVSPSQSRVLSRIQNSPSFYVPIVQATLSFHVTELPAELRYPACKCLDRFLMQESVLCQIQATMDLDSLFVTVDRYRV